MAKKMETPILLMQVLNESFDMYKENKHKLLKDFEPMLDNRNIDMANLWMDQIDKSKAFILVALLNYIENYKETPEKPAEFLSPYGDDDFKPGY